MIQLTNMPTKNKIVCMKDCYKCNNPYMITKQRWCYDSKINELFNNFCAFNIFFFVEKTNFKKLYISL